MLLIIILSGCTSEQPKEASEEQDNSTVTQVNSEEAVEPTREQKIEQLYQELKEQYPVADCSQNEVEEAAECPKPDSLSTDLKENINIQIILDSSKSMDQLINGRSKMEIAQDEISKFVARFPKNTYVSFRVYGQEGANDLEQKSLSCSSTEIVYSFQELDQAKFNTAIQDTKPAGWTPIAKALEEAKKDFAEFKGENNTNIIYLVTDGLETCGGDPAAAAAALADSDIEGVINVIGFDVQESTDSLKEIAKNGNGEYFDAKNDAALKKIFEDNFNWYEWTTYYNCVWLNETTYSNNVWLKESLEANCTWLELTTQKNKIYAEISNRKKNQDQEAIEFGEEVYQRIEQENDAIIQEKREKKDQLVEESRQFRDKAVENARTERDERINP
ncbi:vWA domain-containing protein [Paenibacillus gallinarum]|nr:VWA domain-containing protein [Paenibacillus gallinarum]